MTKTYCDICKNEIGTCTEFEVVSSGSVLITKEICFDCEAILVENVEKTFKKVEKERSKE